MDLIELNSAQIEQVSGGEVGAMGSDSNYYYGSSTTNSTMDNLNALANCINNPSYIGGNFTNKTANLAGGLYCAIKTYGHYILP
jgi:hypothetical protein